MWTRALLVSLVLAAPAATASAQTAPEPARWDVHATAGGFWASTGTEQSLYGDDWYAEGRYAAAIGRFWAAHLKTEVEFAQAGEGSRYVQAFIREPNGAAYPISVRQFHRVQQLTGRVVWQFLENAWVHPYIGVGGTLEIDRRRSFTPEQYRYPTDPRTAPAVLINPPQLSGPNFDYHRGLSVSGGAKVFVASRAYLNTGVSVMQARPATRVSVFAGFGFEF